MMLKQSMKMGGIVILASGLFGLTAATQPAGAAGGSQHLSYFERNESFTYTDPAGATQNQVPNGPPSPGGVIEFSDRDYRGNATHHASSWSATDHFVCTFSSSDIPSCAGQIASGSSMLVVKGAGGQGTFTIPVVSGTGAFHGYHGTLTVSDIGQTLNANIVVNVSR
jgi:hypothetical protein